jgi:hypothetical protein
MSCRSDIERLQELVLRLSPGDAKLINRLERTRLMLDFMLAGVHRPTAHDKIASASPVASLAVSPGPEQHLFR